MLTNWSLKLEKKEKKKGQSESLLERTIQVTLNN